MGSLSLPDLDVPLEHLLVHEAEFQSRDRHCLGDGTEIEHTLVLEHLQVIQRVRSVSQCVEDHRRLNPHRTADRIRISGMHLLHLRKPILLPPPDFSRPEIPLLVTVFAEITDDVGFLEEEAHGIAQFELAGHGWILFARGSKET